MIEWTIRTLLFSAFRAGSLAAVSLRHSDHAPSGNVVALSFACPRRAGRFAARWSVRLGGSVALRRSPCSLWSVSVPVRLRHTRRPAGAQWNNNVRGGLRAFLVVIGSSGLGNTRGKVSL